MTIVEGETIILVQYDHKLVQLVAAHVCVRLSVGE